MYTLHVTIKAETPGEVLDALDKVRGHLSEGMKFATHSRGSSFSTFEMAYREPDERHWKQDHGSWLYDDGFTRGACVPVAGVGWEARAKGPGGRMRTERSFTLRSAQDIIETFARDRRPKGGDRAPGG